MSYGGKIVDARSCNGSWQSNPVSLAGRSVVAITLASAAGTRAGTISPEVRAVGDAGWQPYEWYRLGQRVTSVAVVAGVALSELWHFRYIRGLYQVRLSYVDSTSGVGAGTMDGWIQPD